MPFFSIIIPTFNRLHSLPNTIESVLHQIFADFEIIIADDGSTDGTANWIKEQKDERIKYIWQTNAGVCAARNKGATIVQGEYLIFLDSDDTVTTNWLLDFHETITTQNAKVVLCKRIINGQTTAEFGYHGFLAGTFAIDRVLFNELGKYDENLKFGENTELKWRIDESGIQTVFINKPNVIYDVSGAGGGSNRTNRIRFFYHVVEKHKVLFSKDKRMAQLMYQVAGVDCYHLGRNKEARNLLWKGFLKHPVSAKAIIRFFYYSLKSI
jgi:glycosyltransferase involved in cell wall biosynthesis